ncbi:MAG TPA: glycerol-3-phosphate 1-O-acyltransferase PlsY [Candidatus Cloacimonadota bacterium]|nr:glycerol-3-phosphate 1-O-acyltransferase PlsY [Candidatus Cloacimonadota bacterium]
MCTTDFCLCPAQVIAIAYLIGSIPFGWLMGKLFFGQDIRQSGSGNIGATNALRRFGTKAGVIVLLLDLGKGLLVMGLARKYLMPQSLEYTLAAAFVILGHIYPIWLNFKGGKGVATAAGAFIMIAPLPLVIALLAFIITVFISRYVSLGSLIAALTLLISMGVYHFCKPMHYSMLILVALLVGLVVYKHKENIKRLVRGEENRISFSKKGSQ